MTDEKKQKNLEIIFILAFFIFSLSAVFQASPNFEWHNQQRAAQILLLLFFLTLSFFIKEVAIPKTTLILITIIFALGLTSGTLSSNARWSLIESSKNLGLILLIAQLSAQEPKSITEKTLTAILLITIAKSLQPAIFYILAFVTGIRDISTTVLVSGFSNPRFFAQFQIIALPIIAALGAHALSQKKHLINLIIFTTACIQWCIAIALGGRGLFLAFACSYFALICLFRNYLAQLSWQVIAFISGFFIYIIAFNWLPELLNMPEVGSELIREGLSAREIIWKLALQMTLDNPWLGVGPMHFSATYNTIAAHPHQMILQWTSEWGIPATLIALYLIGAGMLRGLAVVRSQHSTPMDAALWLSLCNALVLAQVDGVFVMPYSEVWVAVIAGLALGRWGQLRSMPAYERTALGMMAIAAFTILLLVLFRELPFILDSNQALPEHYNGFKPRFWTNGWIGQ